MHSDGQLARQSRTSLQNGAAAAPRKKRAEHSPQKEPNLNNQTLITATLLREDGGRADEEACGGAALAISDEQNGNKAYL